jgi:hypothetical protein
MLSKVRWTETTCCVCLKQSPSPPWFNFQISEGVATSQLFAMAFQIFNGERRRAMQVVIQSLP